MQRFAKVVVALVLLLAGCDSQEKLSIDDRGCASGGGTAVIEWVDIVKFDGVSYGTDMAYGRRLTRRDVGDVFAHTRCKLADKVTDPGYDTRDGDATFLEPGTALYEVDGYEPAFRLAARRDGKWTIYESDYVADAQTGRELLDIEGKVTYIGVNSPKDGRTEIGAIRDKEAVSRLVTMVLGAPVDQDLNPDEDEYDQQRFVAFHLEDGTVTSRALYPESGLLWRGIRVPEAFAEAIEDASSPT